MIPKYSKKFLKELANIPSDKRQVLEFFVFEFIKQIDSLDGIKNLKKLQGHKSAYRVRFGDYRLGFFYEDGEIQLERVIHRSKFYRKFP